MFSKANWIRRPPCGVIGVGKGSSLCPWLMMSSRTGPGDDMSCDVSMKGVNAVHLPRAIFRIWKKFPPVWVVQGVIANHIDLSTFFLTRF